MAVTGSGHVLGSLLILGCLMLSVRAQTMPTGCTYSEGLFTCSYATLNSNSLIPLDATGFTPIPQRLRLTNLPSSLSTAIFNANFASLSTSDYDTNYPATLELECYPGSTLTFTAGWLANMDHIEEFRIINCQMGSIPASAFSEIGTIDRFFVENGTISAMDNGMLTGVSVVRNSSASPAFPKHHGEIRFINTKFSGTLDGAVFGSQSGVYSMVLRNMGLTTIPSNLLDGLTSVRYLDLSHNPFTSLPDTLFANLTSLGEIRMHGIDIDVCSCASLWFLDYAYQNMLSFHGDVVCTNTSGHENKLAWQFYHDNCVTYGDDCADGISMAGSCLTVIDLTGYIIGGVAFILGWVVLGLSIHTMKTLDGKGGPSKTGLRFV